ncbi:MAG: DinB family protein [Ginsengibacter sp.]
MPANMALLTELKHEASGTRKMIERVPTDHFSWKPHEKSMTLGRLATHIAELSSWVVNILQADEFDLAGSSFKPEGKENTEAILQVFDARLADAIAALEYATDDKMNALWTLRQGDHIIFQLPCKVALRNMAFNHLYHHRGQLSVYLRLLQVPLPGMYGPTADERP